MSEDLAEALMSEFADSTGVSGKAAPRRYLWTDAFAVCNFLGLYRRTGDDSYLNFAVELVNQVHHVLGRHRADDPRRGWISGLPEEAGELHPTRGGLRIGKALPERRPEEQVDSELEWDRDGQYFHYLTKWMHALDCLGRATAEHRYQRWAAELATTAHHVFTYQRSPDGPKRMVWKMSIDLRRPLVSSMGQHDPLDGLITCLELQTAGGFDEEYSGELARAIDDLTDMCQPSQWATEDPLGIGGLLEGAARLARLVFECGVEQRDLLLRLLNEAGVSLEEVSRSSLLRRSAERRLAFRELGLSIGLRGLELTSRLAARDRDLAAVIEDLLLHRQLIEQIEAFWSDPKPRRSSTWKEHMDINMVMLATSLEPAGYFPP